jgi:hypothetical protein
VAKEKAEPTQQSEEKEVEEEKTPALQQNVFPGGQPTYELGGTDYSQRRDHGTSSVSIHSQSTMTSSNPSNRHRTEQRNLDQFLQLAQTIDFDDIGLSSVSQDQVLKLLSKHCWS